MAGERYGDTGVMTFIVNQDGVVYQKNLGPNTAALARAMTAYNPDASWEKVAAEDRSSRRCASCRVQPGAYASAAASRVTDTARPSVGAGDVRRRHPRPR